MLALPVQTRPQRSLWGGLHRVSFLWAGNGGSEALSNLSKTTQPGRGAAGTEVLVPGPEISGETAAPQPSLNLGYSQGWTAPYQADRAESSAPRETWSASELFANCVLHRPGHPEVPEELPRGEPEAGGWVWTPPLPPESTGQLSFCFTYWIRAFACLSPLTTGERNLGCGGALESSQGKAGGSGRFLPL